MTWISNLDGPTKGRHEEVPKDIKEEAERLAKKALEGDDDDEEEDDEDDDDDVEMADATATVAKGGYRQSRQHSRHD